MVPRATNLVADDEPLGERPAVVRARRAHGEDLRAASREEHGLAAARARGASCPRRARFAAMPCARSGPVSFVSPLIRQLWANVTQRQRPRVTRSRRALARTSAAHGVDRDAARLDVDHRDVAAVELAAEDHLGDRAPRRAARWRAASGARRAPGRSRPRSSSASTAPSLTSSEMPARAHRDPRASERSMRRAISATSRAAERREREHLVDAVVELGRQRRARGARRAPSS